MNTQKRYPKDLPAKMRALGIDPALAARVATEVENETRRRVKMALSVMARTLATPGELKRLRRIDT